jgi:hypothetical protein
MVNERTHGYDSNATMGEKIANLYVSSRPLKFDLFRNFFCGNILILTLVLAM